MKILTCEQMKKAEQKAVEQGLSYLSLMENAGRGCYLKIRKNMPHSAKKVCVLCGKGNNAGDGFIIAGLLLNDGYDVTVALAMGEPKSEISLSVYDKLKEIECNIIDCEKDDRAVSLALKNADVIIDAVFGTGFKGKVEGKILRMFEMINKLGSFVFSIDVPSGVDADGSDVEGVAVSADITLVICAYKPCHIFYPARQYCGKTIKVSIGIDDSILDECSFVPYYSMSRSQIKSHFKNRNSISNKGDYGKVLEICGSKRMPGAAVLCAKGVLRSGAGLLRIAFPEEAYSAIAPQVTEAIMYPLENDDRGFLEKSALFRVIKAVEEADVVVIGCGLGITEDTSRIVCEVIRKSKVPVVVDADGINIVAQNINILRNAQAPIILTPHPGEMSRLTGIDIDALQKNRIQTVKKFAFEKKVTVVLKGANTVVGVDDERSVYVNTTGNAGMATGGSGDLLAGIIAGFLAQGMSCKDACICAVYVHGVAGDIASAEKSMMSCLPSDIIEKISEVLLKMER